MNYSVLLDVKPTVWLVILTKKSVVGSCGPLSHCTNLCLVALWSYFDKCFSFKRGKLIQKRITNTPLNKSNLEWACASGWEPHWTNGINIIFGLSVLHISRI